MSRHTANMLGFLALLMACAGVAAQEAPCAITDPISGKCMASGTSAARAVGNGAVEAKAPAGQPYSLGGVFESSGYYECAMYDEKTKRCTLRASSAEQRESAVQTGIEAAMSGMRIQQEAILRGQQMGMFPGGPTAGVPARSSYPQGNSYPSAKPAGGAQAKAGSAVTAKADGFRECVDAKMASTAQARGRMPTPDQQMAAVSECSR